MGKSGHRNTDTDTEAGRQRVHVTIDKDLLAWLDEQVDEDRLWCRSQGVNIALKALRYAYEEGYKKVIMETAGQINVG